ncbi:protocadherin alpha-8-like isoform X14 [Denticeps clupeoides]|uniref:protocadherin alpha-8-like isoform X14 n=1 Tax=Denticeps clupeoides TaxID=299321 RepID=UPI0010A53F5D|nr:protocadherin alpha-8-like isoform X14 [Denticeps clupeoides]
MGIVEQRRAATAFLLLLCLWNPALAQIRYSVLEEVKEDSVVGNIAKDVGLDVGSLEERGLRIVSEPTDGLFRVNQNNGALHVRSNIDREEICEGSGPCLINLKMIVENPLEMHYVQVEVVDINDHAPNFAEQHLLLEIAENKAPGNRFELQSARDPDVGTNSVRNYKLGSNEHFSLELRDSGDEEKIPLLVLKKPLDREHASQHALFLTAIDGGTPPKSGVLNITVTVYDINDNHPVCGRDVYAVSIAENVASGTTITTVNATDADDDLNGEVVYSFGRNIKRRVLDVFALNEVTGEITVKGPIDFEENEVYRVTVQASDKGQPPMTTDCRAIINIQDENDNAPEIDITSFSRVVPEDTKAGTVISIISVKDKDSGLNGKVVCAVLGDVPFELKPSFQGNMYSLVSKGSLDRERVTHYDVTIQATDLGQPALSAFKTLSIQVSDVNDNSPDFAQNSLVFYLEENNQPGTPIFSVSASDKDLNENAAISYHIARGESSRNELTSFLNIHSENGKIVALKSFDFETVKSFQFQVVATDSGTPPLSSNATVNVFILDQNDNSPIILFPVSSNGSTEGVEELPRNVKAGHLVTKVRAYDPDIGYNGWLLFSLLQVSDHTLFGLDRYTGQIRTLRSFTESDEAEHKLVILVKDNGNISLSATATLLVKVTEPKEAHAISDVKNESEVDEENNVTFYLIITLGLVSLLFLISVVILVVMQCTKRTDCSSKYLQDTNYDGTLCHSIQYRSGDKRYMLVGPRMSIGSTIVSGSNGNTLILPDHRGTKTREDCVYPGWILQHRASQAHSHTGMHADG